MYDGPLINEQLNSKALAGGRRPVILAAKFGLVYASSRVVNGGSDYIITSCEGSLWRQNTDVIDLYYLHRVDPDIPIENIVGRWQS